jgi:hypothetical protein
MRNLYRYTETATQLADDSLAAGRRARDDNVVGLCTLNQVDP